MPVPLRVVSVERSLFEGDVDFIVANGADGELGVLPRHAALMTILKPGALKIVQGTEEQLLFVGGGFLEVLPDRVTVLADVAEHAEEISMEQVLASIGAKCNGEGAITIDARGASAPRVPDDLGKRMRATILLLGALLGRFGSARLPRPGGDDIGARRVEQHLRGLRQMGAT